MQELWIWGLASHHLGLESDGEKLSVEETLAEGAANQL